MLFQFLLTKFSKSKVFSCLQRVDHVTNYCQRPNARLKSECFQRVIRVLGKKLSPKNGIIFIFQYTYDQAKVMAAAFTRLIQTVARQKTRSRPFATWKLSVEVGL